MQRFASGNGRECGRSSRIYFIAVHEFSHRTNAFLRSLAIWTLGFPSEMPSFASNKYQVLSQRPLEWPFGAWLVHDAKESTTYFKVVHEFSSQDKKRSKTRSERFSQVVGYLTLGIAAKVPSFVSTYQSGNLAKTNCRN